MRKFTSTTIGIAAMTVAILGVLAIVLFKGSEPKGVGSAIATAAESGLSEHAAKSIPTQPLAVAVLRNNTASPNASPHGIVPLAQSAKELEKQAINGDVESAKRLSHEAMNCSNAIHIANAQVSRTDALTNPNIDQKEYKKLNQAMEKDSSKVDFALEKLKTLCAGLSDEETLALRNRAVVRAAAMGDADSQMCALNTIFPAQTESMSDDEIVKRKELEQSYIDQGYQRGDWRAVQQNLNMNMRSCGELTASPEQSAANCQKVYQIEQLLKLGADGDYANQIASTISNTMQMIQFLRQTKGMPLSDNQLSSIDTEVKEQYLQSFASSKFLNSPSAYCQ